MHLIGEGVVALAELGDAAVPHAAVCVISFKKNGPTGLLCDESVDTARMDMCVARSEEDQPWGLRTDKQHSRGMVAWWHGDIMTWRHNDMVAYRQATCPEAWLHGDMVTW